MGSDVRELQEVMMDVSYVEWIYVIILRVGMGIWVYGVAAIRLFFWTWDAKQFTLRLTNSGIGYHLIRRVTII